MKKIKAFTLVEILFICILLWAWLVSIFQAAHRAKTINERITQSIIANQIATEGVEILYQFRNTNFLKHEWRDLHWQTWWRDVAKRQWRLCRLALDYSKENTGCIRERLWTWYYYIVTDNWINTITGCSDDNCYSWWENISTGNLSAVNIIDNRYAICLKSWVWTPCPEWHEAWWDQSKYWKFYRAIRGVGVYDMASDTTWWNLISNTPVNLALISAQEYRFCSMVARKGWANWVIEICSTMTNFIE